MKHILRCNKKTNTYWLDGKILDPKRSQAYRNHSPDGFSHGYAGSGPAQLALAIMLELRDSPEGYQEFKLDYIAPLPLEQDFEIEFDDNDI
jgi:hypothetical protein